MLQEFKEFALRGNVVDMAVGIIIGAAFSTIVRSLVDDIIMPPIGVVTGGVGEQAAAVRDAVPRPGVRSLVVEAREDVEIARAVRWRVTSRR